MGRICGNAIGPEVLPVILVSAISPPVMPPTAMRDRTSQPYYNLIGTGGRRC
jgi:hypothetical protein